MVVTVSLTRSSGGAACHDPAEDWTLAGVAGLLCLLTGHATGCRRESVPWDGIHNTLWYPSARRFPDVLTQHLAGIWCCTLSAAGLVTSGFSAWVVLYDTLLSHSSHSGLTSMAPL